VQTLAIKLRLILEDVPIHFMVLVIKDFIVKVSLGLAYPQRIIKLYHTVITDLGRAVAAAKRANETHNQLADAHGKKADYWQQMSVRLGFIHPAYTSHMDAMGRHRKIAAEFASHHDDLKKGKGHPLKSEFLSNSSHQRAQLQLLHLKVSNKYEEASHLAYQAGDKKEAKRLFEEMRDHGHMSVRQNVDTRDSESDARVGEFYANWKSDYYKRRLEERKTGEVARSSDPR